MTQRRDRVLEQVAQAIPTHEIDNTSSDLSSSLECISLLVHAVLVTHRFELVGFEADELNTECQKLSPRLPTSWNSSVSGHSFVYTHPTSKLKFVFRTTRRGTKVEVDGHREGEETAYRFDIAPRDVVQNQALPLRIPLVEGHEDRSTLVDKIRGLFQSDQAVDAFINKFTETILQKLTLNLNENDHGPDHSRQVPAEAPRQQEPAMPNPEAPALPKPYPLPEMAQPPRQPQPNPEFPAPDFEDPYDIHRIRAPPARPNLPNIGGNDLYPPNLGPNDPLRPSLVGGGGGGLRMPGGNGGMHPTFDELIPGRHGDPDQFDPHMPPGVPGNVPPGARWDPFGPGGGPRNGPGSGGFGGFGGGF